MLEGRARRAARGHRAHPRGGARARRRDRLPADRARRRSRWAAAAAASPRTAQELAALAARSARDLARSSEILVEESIAGWKEFELEVMRDGDDNGVIVCSIENVDPMGVHTGDSITVAPAADAHRPRVPADARRRAPGASARSASRPAARTCSSRSTRATGRQVLIEMNPRVSRSSALASKATGFPIAKIAALLAVGLPAGRDHERHHRGDARRRSSRRSTTSW